MEINKQYLEEKLKLFTIRYTKLNEEINEHLALSRKLDGAIEAIQILLKELDEVKTEDK